MQDTVFDLIISNASVINGSGLPAQVQDIAIIDDRIANIGNLAGATSKQRINAEGLVLAPGFIDVHTHDDIEVIRNPSMECKLSQGVTTVIVGNCGISATPVTLTSEPIPCDQREAAGRERIHRRIPQTTGTSPRRP